MKIEDIKVGWIYNVRLKCIIREIDEPLPEFSFVAVDSQGVATCDDLVYFTEDDLPAFSYPSPPVPPTPAQAPCRKFRKGDKVRLIEWNGRKPFDTLHGVKLNPGEVHIVIDDEYERNEVYIGMSAADEEQSLVHACNLELVTPVEDMGPYSVRHNAVHAAWSIYGPFDLSAVNYFYGERYPYTKETAKAAAEAERDRLNAENRKEQY